MISTDEQALRQRLREEISRAEAGPAPVDAVLRRGKAIRARRRVIAVSTVAALAVTVAVSIATAGMTPRAARPSAPVASGGHPGTKNIWNLAHPGAPGGVFVSGVVNGKPWRLAAGNIAGQAPWCLPAVLLNGADAGLLPIDSTATPVGDPSFLTDVPGWPGTGFAFIQVPAGATEVTADLPGGVSLGVPPATVTLCGERFRLAGFGFAGPHQGVADIRVRLASGRTATFYPSPGLFSPDSGTPGVWVSLNRVAGDAGSGVIGSGAIGGTSWQVSMTLGPAGQCYILSASLGGTTARASDCVPIGAPPAGVSLEPLPLAMPVRLAGYAGLVSPRAAYLMASLSDGTSRRVEPVDIGGRKYFGLAVGHGVTLAGLTVYDAAGRAVGTTVWVSAVK